MPRQNFLSKEAFLNATEKQTRDSLLSIPVFAPDIQIIGENKLAASLRFAYQRSGTESKYFIDVSVLPLNEEFVRVSFHSTYPNGAAFYTDSNMSAAVNDFESALNAAVKADTSLYQPIRPKAGKSQRFTQHILGLVATLGFLFLKKKLS